MKCKHICFIVPGYPTCNDPVYTFVKQLVCSIADLGIKCTVIAPQSLTKVLIRKTRKRPFSWQDTTDQGNKVDIFQPSYISWSNLRLFGRSISSLFSERAIIRAFDKIKISPDVLYAHFWSCGVVAGIIGKKHNLPVFVATGESVIRVRDLYTDAKIQGSMDAIKGVICVSSKNMQESIDLGLASKENMIVIPNAVNDRLFYPMNKEEAREKLGFNQDDFIVAFTGSFTHRKGVLRLAEAVKKVGGVKTIYIGSGPLQPNGEDILFKGRLPHNEIVCYLNAADAFVLPTLAEGCCNAIIEAMACGLPIISSALPFNDEILDNNNSIRIDPYSVDDIARAIKHLKDNPNVRKKMSEASVSKSKSLTVRTRAMNVLNFISERMN